LTDYKNTHLSEKKRIFIKKNQTIISAFEKK